jgi:hypothetical protein
MGCFPAAGYEMLKVMTGCLICAKHRGEGPLGGIRVWEDEHSLVFHSDQQINDLCVRLRAHLSGR